jgi:ABC-2 type transport system ATP-binding protein
MKKHEDKYSIRMRRRPKKAQAIMEDLSLLRLNGPFNGIGKQGLFDIRHLLKELCTAEKAMPPERYSAADTGELCDTVCERDAGKPTAFRQGVMQ